MNVVTEKPKVRRKPLKDLYNKKVTVCLTQEQYENLKELVNELSLTNFSDGVRLIIDKYFDRHETKTAKEVKRELEFEDLIPCFID